ncbi:MAG: hypothetical protein ACJ766_09840 [Thermoleophilaceae bacterium]
MAKNWLSEAGWAHDVALGEPFGGGVDWRAVSPDSYSHVVQVCGPIGWPAILRPEETDRLGELYDWCLTEEARVRARACADAGRAGAELVRADLLEALGPPPA